jgi:hypothetical protein
MKMSLSEIYRRAKQAALVVRKGGDTPETEVKYRRLARDSGLGMRRFTCLVNAFEAAGESGVRALTYRKKAPSAVMEAAMVKVNEYLRAEHRLAFEKAPKARIDYEAASEGNRITLYETRPVYNDPAETTRLEICQIRYTDYDNRWHLYWMRKFRRWWPYVPKQPVCTIEDCLREIEDDAWGCFWG